MRENWVKQKLREGSVSVGSWISMDDVLAAEVMANAGFDWLVIDMEHGPVSMEAAQRIIAAIRTTPTVPLVRVGWNESGLIQPALDIGAFGIVVPMVNTPAQAQQVVRDTRYPPLGERSRGGMRSRWAYATLPPRGNPPYALALLAAVIAANSRRAACSSNAASLVSAMNSYPSPMQWLATSAVGTMIPATLPYSCATTGTRAIAAASSAG